MGVMKKIWQQMREENWQGTAQEYLSLWIERNPDKLFVRSKQRWEEIEKENYTRKCDEESFYAEPNEPKKDE